MLIVIDVILSILISAGFLWLGMKAAGYYYKLAEGTQYCTYGELIFISAVIGMASAIPFVGWPISLLILFYLLKQVSEASVAEILMIVIFSRIAYIIVMPFLLVA